MRKIIIISAILFSTVCVAQKHKVDTSVSKQKDTVVILSLKMPVQNWNYLLQLLKTADEKPSIIKAFTDFITSNLKKDEEKN